MFLPYTFFIVMLLCMDFVAHSAHAMLRNVEEKQDDAIKNSTSILGMNSQDFKDLSGWLVVNKPPGVVSRKLALRIQKALNVPKAGHVGTLDPFATGVLPIAFGKATRLTSYLMEHHKTYSLNCIGEQKQIQEI